MDASDSIPAPTFITGDDAEIPKFSGFEGEGGDNSTKMAKTVNIKVPVPTADDDDIEQAKISDFEVAASYNWLDELTPTILVPGIPPVWTPPNPAPFLKPDTGPRYVDQNADRNPASPLTALIRAVQSSKPEFNFAAIDIITDRRPIRKLYGFVAGDGGKPFNFGVTVLGNTALFTRMEDRTRDEQAVQREYRQAFETAYLKIPLSGKDSTSHHRVVRYVFGGMTFLVRSAIDAYFRDRVEEIELADDDDGDKQTTVPEELTDFVKAMSLGEPTPSLSVFTASVAVIRGGRSIPHAATLELSTRSKWAPKGDLLARKLPDLWISQTANFMEAYHGSGGNPGFRSHANGGGGKWRGGFQSSSWNGGRYSRLTGKSGGTMTQSPNSNSNSHPTGNSGRGQWQSSKSDREQQQSGSWKCATKPPQPTSDQPLTQFTDIKIKPLATQLVAWEAANAETLGGLVVVIKKVIEASKAIKGPCIVSYDGKMKERVLEVCRAVEGEVAGLPQELEELFLVGGGGRSSDEELI